MHCVQILLPLYNEYGEPFPKKHYLELRSNLTERFGGITVYTRSPATGFWKENEDKTVKDEIIIYEIMAEDLNKEWWHSCRKSLECTFSQDKIIIRTWEIEVL